MIRAVVRGVGVFAGVHLVLYGGQGIYALNHPVLYPTMQLWEFEVACVLVSLGVVLIWLCWRSSKD